MKHFGEHITIDGYEGDYTLLNSKETVLGCLQSLPDILQMKKLSEPVVYYAKANHTKDPGGWTGVVVIAESHISIHTFPKRGFVSADVYTCRNGLDQQTIIDYFKNTFGLKKVETSFIIRGKEYPSQNIY